MLAYVLGLVWCSCRWWRFPLAVILLLTSCVAARVDVGVCVGVAVAIVITAVVRLLLLFSLAVIQVLLSMLLMMFSPMLPHSKQWLRPTSLSLRRPFYCLQPLEARQAPSVELHK